MDSSYFRIKNNTTIEFKERRSLFLGHTRLVTSDKQARNEIKALNTEFKDATHNCWAYRIGYPNYLEYFSDAGEPSGTAGKPIAGSIHKTSVTDVIVVVTRYFGGIKLGVRGLIDAYGRAGTLALQASGCILHVPSLTLSFTIPYSAQKDIFHYLSGYDLTESQAELTYSDVISCNIPVPVAMQVEIASLMNGFQSKGWLIAWNWQE